MSDPTTLKRPKPGDNEEELFRMQEEFFQSRQQPSAKIVNLRGQNHKTFSSLKSPTSDNNNQPTRFRSKFAERRAVRDQRRLSTSHPIGSVINPEVIATNIEDKFAEKLADPVQNLLSAPSNIILGNIVEKKFDMNMMAINIPAASQEKEGFPKVFVLEEKGKNDDFNSLFYCNLIKKTPLENASTSKLQINATDEKFSSILVGGPLGSEIHRENIKKLSKMSQEEILKEKAQLESTLSPDLIKFIKMRKNAASHSQNSSKNLDEDSTMEVDAKLEQQKWIKLKENAEMKMEIDTTIEPPAPVSEIIEKAVKSRWVHMDDLEPKKLEWMKDINPNPPDTPTSEEPYNARFNFEGLLLAYKDENISINKGLHHHGEEPERPGYSLQELLQLSRSATQQQRCMALNTLANIMEKSRKGWYDKALDPAPLSALSTRNILLLLRFSLDNCSTAIVTSTLQALRAFLYSEADEVCLDRLYGWRYEDGVCSVPELVPPKNDVSDMDNLKDHELAQLDCVAAAIRSDIVLRIRYILREMRPPPVGVTAALEILIRLARQSKITALNIASTPNLLDVIVNNFIPLTTDRLLNVTDLEDVYGVPNVTAVRLCRILVEYAGKPVAERLHNLRIINRLLSYATSEPGEAGQRLPTEALRLWELLYTHGSARESVGGARLMLGSQLQLLLSNHDLQSASELSCDHVAALIAISCHEDTLKPTVATLLSKWSTELDLLTSPTWSNTKLVGITLNSLQNASSFRTKWLSKSKVFDELTLVSNLLSKQAPATNRNPTSLPDLGVLTQNGQLQPIISVNSCLPFLSTLINVFYKNAMLNEVKILFEQPEVIKYLNRLSSSNWSLENSWYTRLELFFVTGLIRISVTIELDEFVRQVILKITIKLISTLPSDTPAAVKEILNLALSNERVSIAKLSDELGALKLNSGEPVRIEIPGNICVVYEDFICTGSWDQAAMPKDWPYLPLVAAYTNHKNKVTWSDNSTWKIVVLLSLELAMPELVEDLSPSLRFSRLILVYLCDTVCLNENVSALLKKTMTKFLKKYYRRLNFTNDVPGVSSFTDLFTAMCEAFCANSYGDDGFSTVLLVPIAQRHNVHYRKLLWSEHAGALRYLRLPPNKLPIPMDEYLHPLESDPSLIECYLTALVRGTIRADWCPMLHKIAIHHSAMYLKGNTKLAMKMKSRIATIGDANLANTLLNYKG